jgi:hypothetical protein
MRALWELLRVLLQLFGLLLAACRGNDYNEQLPYQVTKSKHHHQRHETTADPRGTAVCVKTRRERFLNHYFFPFFPFGPSAASLFFASLASTSALLAFSWASRSSFSACVGAF